MLRKACIAHETAITPLATAAAGSARCGNSGNVEDKAPVLDYWVRYREGLCARNALRSPSSVNEVKETVWPSVLAGFLLAPAGEEGVFRNIVIFLEDNFNGILYCREDLRQQT